jgi:hypothetical protein
MMTERWPVELCRSRTANGGWEWYFTVGDKRIYPGEHRVGVFTGPSTTHAEAFGLVLGAWTRARV